MSLNTHPAINQEHMKKNLIISLLAVLIASCVNSQTPPTLSAGIGMLTGSKGTIDVELLSQIIADKQAELKKEGLRRLILNETRNASFVDQNFAYITLTCLLDYKNKKVIEKELIESATNYALVYACELSVIDLVQDSSFKTFTTNNNKYSNIPTSFDQEKRKILRDLIWDVMSEDENLKNRGYFKVHGDLQHDYSLLNKYLNLNDESSKEFKELREMLTTIISLLSQHGRLFTEFADKNQTIETLESNTSQNDSTKENQVHTQMYKLLSSLTTVKSTQERSAGADPISSKRLDEVIRQCQIAVQGFHEFTMISLQEDKGMRNISNNDYYFLKKLVTPLVTTLVLEYGYPADNLVTLTELQERMHQQLIDIAVKEMADMPYLKQMPFSKLNSHHLLEFIGSLDALDVAKTYERVFNFIQSLSNKKCTIEEYPMLNALIFYLENFTSINSDQNIIEIDVEEIILHLYEQYEKKNNQMLQVYFGIGVNQAYSLTASPLTTSEGGDIDNFSFAAEKLGLKIRLANFRSNHYEFNRAKRAESNREYQSENPFVEDFYILGFGSGLLYNLADITTSKTAAATSFVGSGIGVHFFNDFDINLYVMRPTSDWDDALYAGFSFDIKITEYLRKLGEKRKATKAEQREEEK